ncbi:MAG TPA: ABC transporter permease [Steroidobacteraceae bacterium]|nr:ABC transporter permease [Steroidobacteraceae bacterium]
MVPYFLRRFAEMLIALWLMSMIVFALGRATGDPVALLLNEYASDQDRIELTQELGLDKPVVTQYAIFIKQALQGDLGVSVSGDRRPALELIAERLPASLLLAVTALIVSIVIGIPLGVLAAVNRDTWIDGAARLAALLGQSVPVFWLGIVLMYLFSVTLGWLPTSGYGEWRHLVLPAVSMGLFTIAAIARLVRVGMIEALQSEYVKLARIKGLSETTVVWKHALRNSLLPVLTYMGAFFATMITGAVVVETVFAWPGIGRLAYESIMNRDFPVMQAVVLTMTVLFMLANLIVDIAYARLDPRIRQ